MSATATRRAVDVLRREVRVAASTGGAEGMNDIEVASLEVGALDIPPFAGRRMLDYDPQGVYKVVDPVGEAGLWTGMGTYSGRIK